MLTWPQKLDERDKSKREGLKNELEVEVQLLLASLTSPAASIAVARQAVLAAATRLAGGGELPLGGTLRCHLQ